MAEYEFTDEQNKTFNKLATSLQRFAIIFGIWGALFVVMGVMDFTGESQAPFGGLVSAIAGLSIVITAFLFLKPVQNFRRITTTQGQDISELLTALKLLNSSHNLLRLVLGIVALASLVGVSMLFMR
jgi:hypothetical protein